MSSKEEPPVLSLEKDKAFSIDDEAALGYLARTFLPGARDEVAAWLFDLVWSFRCVGARLICGTAMEPRSIRSSWRSSPEPGRPPGSPFAVRPVISSCRRRLMCTA